MSKYAKVLTLANFTKWLETKHPRTKVGLACESDFCPLAKFLTQSTGVSFEVDGSQAIPNFAEKNEFGGYDQDEENVIELPQWAVDFINRVDDSGYNSVSAMKALSIAESSTLGRAARMSEY